MNIIDVFLQNRYNKEILTYKLKEYHYNINKISNIINSLTNYPEYDINTIDIKRYNFCCQYFINIILFKNKNKIHAKDLYKFNIFKYKNIIVSKNYKDITFLFEIISYILFIKNNLLERGLISNELFNNNFNYKEFTLNKDLNLSFHSSQYNNSFYNYLYLYIPNFLISSINIINNLRYINDENNDTLIDDFIDYNKAFKRMFNIKDNKNINRNINKQENNIDNKQENKSDNKQENKSDDKQENNQDNKLIINLINKQEINPINKNQKEYKFNYQYNKSKQYNKFNKHVKQYIFQKIFKVNNINKLLQLYDKNNELNQYNIQNIRNLYYYITNSYVNLKNLNQNLSNIFINLFYAIPLKVYPIYIINNLLLTFYYENLKTNNYNYINDYKITYDNKEFSFTFNLNKNNEYYIYIKHTKFKKVKLKQFNLYQELTDDINFNKIKVFPKYLIINTTLYDPNIYKICGFTTNIYNNYSEKLIKTNKIINIFQRNITINKNLFSKYNYFLKKFIIFDNKINDYIMIEIKDNKFYKINNEIKEIQPINITNEFNNSIFADDNNVYDNIEYYKIIITMYQMI